MMNPSTLPRLLAAVLLASVVTACTDRNPVTGDVPTEPAPGPLTSRLECRADVTRRTVECAAAAPSGPRANLFVGSQDVYVKLRTTGVAFAAGVLSADVTLQNLLSQPMGTSDGTTPAPDGIRVFFASGPTTTGGSGAVTVQNPDGTGVFTAAGQPYYQYPGVLGPGETSAAKSWRFQADPGVSTFSFTLYVSTGLPAESGWIDLLDPNPVLAPGQSDTLLALVFTAVRSGVPNAPVGWASSNETVATVSAAGVVTAVAPGTATITATSGERTGYTRVTVADVDVTAPEITGVTASPDPVNAGDTVTLTVSVTDAGVGVSAAGGTLRLGGYRLNCGGGLTSGTRANGTYTCKARVAPGAAPGAWALSVDARDQRGNVRVLSSEQLAAAGFPSQVTVADATPDATGPELTALSISPSSTVDAGDSVTVTATVTDAGTGVARVTATLQSPVSVRLSQCAATIPTTGTANSGTWVCRVPIPPGTTPGTWRISAVTMDDRTGNRTSASSVAPSFPPTVTVVSPAPDSTRPTLRRLFMPTAASVGDVLPVTMRTADAGTGVERVRAVFQSHDYFQVVGCFESELVDGTPAFGTFRCTFRLPSAFGTGTWTLVQAEIIDRTGNTRLVFTGELQALGYPTTIVVTP
jgi:Bacterial Ig-like domain (group 2)